MGLGPTASTTQESAPITQSRARTASTPQRTGANFQLNFLLIKANNWLDLPAELCILAVSEHELFRSEPQVKGGMDSRYYRRNLWTTPSNYTWRHSPAARPSRGAACTKMMILNADTDEALHPVNALAKQSVACTLEHKLDTGYYQSSLSGHSQWDTQ